MGSFKLKLLVGCCVSMAVLATLGSSAALGGSTTAQAPLPCKAGQASTPALPCTRAWMKAGCAAFLPLIHSVFGASFSVAAKQNHVPGALTCAYDTGSPNSRLGFGFNPKGVTAAIFQADRNDAPSGWTACRTGADASTDRPVASSILISHLGNQAYEFDPCPGAEVVTDPSDPNTSPDFAEGVVRVGATDFSASGYVTLKQMDTFLRDLVAKYH